MTHPETAMVALCDLTPWPGSPRRGDVSLIADSLRLNGQYRGGEVLDFLGGEHGDPRGQ